MEKMLTVVSSVLVCFMLINVQAGTSKPARGKQVAVSKEVTSNVQPCSKRELARCKTTEIDPPEKWDFFQFGVWFDVPSVTKVSNVYGIKIGAPFCSGHGMVKGIETAVFCGATDNITGLQACILTSVSKRLEGLQFSIVNYAEEVDGLQLGVFNMAKKKSFQIGILNYIEDAAIPWLPVINFKFDDTESK